MISSRLSAYSALAVLGISLAQAASAQTATTNPSPSASTAAADSDAGQDIVVTGSRIRHNPLDQASPITFVDQGDIARTGLSSISDVLQRLPSSGGGLNTRNNSSGNFGNPPDGGGVGAGSSEIDLRYLGSRRTLVLVDGLRFINGSAASGVPGSVDLNAIPEQSIERVEVLQDGASSIYGSDAIAGVINIITKKKQDGLSLTAQNGIWAQGDGLTQNYGGSYGWHSDDSGTSIVVGGNWIKQGTIFAGDRKGSRFPTPNTDQCDSSCSSGTPNGRYIVLNPVTGEFEDLTLRAPVTGIPTYDPTGVGGDYRAFSSPSDRYNFAPRNYILTPNKRVGAFVTLDQDIGSSVKFSGKFFYNKRTSKNQAAPLPLFVGPDAGNGNLLDTITISANNPYNPFGEDLGPGTLSFIGRRVVEGGPRRYSQNVQTYYGAGTLSGDFKLGAGTWYWDVNGIYSENHAKQTELGNINAAKLAKALGPLAGCTGDCVPFNLFGGLGSITPEMLAYVGFDQHDKSMQRLWDGSANLTGTIVDLPAGPLGIAIGYEHRDQKGSFTPDPIIQAGLGSDIPATATSGHIKADEVYGELQVPLLKDTPFFKSLNANFSARYSDYSTSGSETTLKGGLDWAPVSDLLLRGSYAQGFRAPTIGELFGTPSRFDQELDDPCSADSPAHNAAVKAACSALGVPVGYVQAGAQKPVITGGNPDLTAEKSRSYTFGGVYSPSWARAGFAKTFTIEANYFHIKVNNAIQAYGADTLLNRCIETGDALSCGAITRSASGAITRIAGLLQNIAGLKTDGIDLNVNFRSQPITTSGTIGLYWTNTFLLNYTQIVPATIGNTVIEREGTEQGNPDQAYPRWKSNVTLDWTSDAITASVTGRYISGVKESQTTDFPLKRRFYTDVQFTVNSLIQGTGMSFTVGANNVLNSNPPACFSCGLNNYDPTTYDVPGRYLYARVGLKL